MSRYIGVQVAPQAHLVEGGEPKLRIGWLDRLSHRLSGYALTHAPGNKGSWTASAYSMRSTLNTIFTFVCASFAQVGRRSVVGAAPSASSSAGPGRGLHPQGPGERCLKGSISILAGPCRRHRRPSVVDPHPPHGQTEPEARGGKGMKDTLGHLIIYVVIEAL